MSHERDSSRPLTDTQRRYLNHIQAADAAGQTLKAYAAEHGLSVAALYSHKATLRKRGHLGADTPTFTRVALMPAAGAAPLRICLTNGVVVEAPADMAPQQVAALCRDLGRLP